MTHRTWHLPAIGLVALTSSACVYPTQNVRGPTPNQYPPPQPMQPMAPAPQVAAPPPAPAAPGFTVPAIFGASAPQLDRFYYRLQLTAQPRICTALNCSSLYLMVFRGGQRGEEANLNFGYPYSMSTPFSANELTSNSIRLGLLANGQDAGACPPFVAVQDLQRAASQPGKLVTPVTPRFNCDKWDGSIQIMAVQAR